MQTLLQWQLSLGNLEWFGKGENKSRAEDCKAAKLGVNEMIQIPLGFARVWTFLPKDGAIDTPESNPKGKLLAQQLLSEAPEIGENKLAAKEIKHNPSKFTNPQGANTPWGDIKNPIVQWLEQLK